MTWIRPRDLSANFQPDGRLMVRSISTGVGALLPSWVASILAYCSEPRSKSDIANALGPRALQVLDQLIEIGLLLPPDHEVQEVMFSNFAGVPVHRRMLSDQVRNLVLDYESEHPTIRVILNSLHDVLQNFRP